MLHPPTGLSCEAAFDVSNGCTAQSAIATSAGRKRRGRCTAVGSSRVFGPAADPLFCSAKKVGQKRRPLRRRSALRADCTRRQELKREASETRCAQTADASLSVSVPGDASPSNGDPRQRQRQKQLQRQRQRQRQKQRQRPATDKGDPSIHSLREHSGRTGVLYAIKHCGDGNGNGKGRCAGNCNGNCRCTEQAISLTGRLGQAARNCSSACGAFSPAACRRAHRSSASSPAWYRA